MNLLRKLLDKFFSFIFRKLLADKKRSKGFLYWIHKHYDDNTSNYSLFKLYPKYSKGFQMSKIKTQTMCSDTAIVLQGLVETKDDITLETVRLYKKMFPLAKIIISTWDYTEKNILKLLEEEGCIIVLSSDIDICGFGNVNYQITTSLAGIQKAHELGAKYTLKSRSDLRFYRENLVDYLKSLMDVFPVSFNNSYNLKGRIISQAGGCGQLFLPNWLQDYWFFGYTEDLLNYFSIPMDDRNIHSAVKYLKGLGNQISGADLVREMPPEIYLCNAFASKYLDSENSVKQFWKDLKDCYIVVDAEAVLSLWTKYGVSDASSFYVEYDGQSNFKDAYKHISFEDWLNIYTGKYIYEEWMEIENSNYIVW